MTTPRRASAVAAPWRTARRWLLVALAALLLLAVLAAVLLYSLRTQAGTRWWLGMWPGLTVEQPQGALLGDFQARRVVWRGGTQDPGVELHGLAWQGLAWRALPAPHAWVGLRVNSMRVQQLTLQPAASAPPPTTTPPTHLRLPLSLSVEALSIGTLTVAAPATVPAQQAPPATEWRDLQASLHLGADGGARHRLTLAHAAWGALQARGEASVTTAAPSVSARLEIDPLPSEPAPAMAWQASLQLDGALTTPRLRAVVRGHAMANVKADPAVARLSAVLQPWSAWPLGELQAEGQGIDLAAVLVGAPRTALRFDASVRTHGAREPAELTLQVRNEAAGLWNDGHLPVRAMDLHMQTRPQELAVMDVRAVSVDWGSREAPAGRLEGRGHLSHDSWALDAQWHDLQPNKLDARAAPMRLSGPWLVSGHGTRWEAQGDWTGVVLGLGGESSGRAASVPTQLRFNLGAQTGDETTWTLRELQARAGAARLDASGSATRGSGTSAPWQLKGRAGLIRFDPLPWWPGPRGSVWREGGHRLEGEASVDLRIAAEALAPSSAAPPAAGGAAHWRALLQSWRGQARLHLADSQLAGVPLSADVELDHMAEGAPIQLNLQAQAGGNALGLQGPLPWPPATARAAAPPAMSSMTFSVQAPDLSTLVPWAALAQPRAAGLRMGGRLQANGRLHGHWPALRSEGQLEANDLRFGAQRLQSGQAQWQLGLAAADPLALRLSLKQASWQGHALAQAELQAQGQIAQHTVSLQAQLDALPPAWVDDLSADTSVSTRPGRPHSPRQTVLALAAQGGLLPAEGDAATEAPRGWQGTLQSLSVRSSDPAMQPWWELGTGEDNPPVAVEATWRPRQGSRDPPASLSLSPGRATLAGTALHWQRIHWQAAGGGHTDSQLDAELRLDPLPVAPWLARWQPEFGWRGDLRVGLQAKVHTHPALQAEVVLQRQSGDLRLTDDSGAHQALGLNTLRLALQAADGQWTLTQAVAGDKLGVLSGAMVATTGPGRVWPGPDTPVQGVLELQVAQLGAWSTWLPTGWRLGGQLRASAGVAGRLGAPEITGTLQGRGLSARHLLEGVNVTDGVADIRLRGDNAHIEHFSARSGAGTLTLQGDARLGDSPQARLTLLLDHFQLLGRVDRRLVTSGQAELSLTREAMTLDGQWQVDEGLIDFSHGDAPQLSDDVQVVRASAPGPAPAPRAENTATPRRTPLRLNLGVNLGDKLHLKGRGLNTRLVGELRVTSPTGEVQVNGNVSTVDGTYKAYGQQLSIERGVVSFSGDVNNPRLDIEATRPHTEVRVGVAITGHANSPRVRLFSDPDMSDIDKLSWLVLGRASDGLGGTDIALLQRAAVALLSGENEGVSDQLIRAIGLDQFSVRQSDGAVKETIVTLGKQISQRWYVGYERGLNVTEGSWQLIYRIAQRFTLRAQTGYENSADLIWTWRWQ